MTRRSNSLEVGWEYLTKEQRDYAIAWVKYHDHKKALEESGHAWNIGGRDRSSDVGRRLLKRVARFVAYLEDQALRQANISVAAIQHELAKMGFSNPQDYMIDDLGPAAQPGGPPQKTRRPKTMDELTRAQAAAIKEFSHQAWTRHDGTVIFVLDEVKLHDKRAALVDLGKTIGMFQDRPVSPGDQNQPQDFSRLSTTRLRELEAILREAAGAVSKVRDATAIESPGTAKAIEHKQG